MVAGTQELYQRHLQGIFTNSQYYYVSENGRRLYDLALGPMALAFVGASDKESVATIKSLEAKFGHEWVHEWLAGRGLNLNDYLEAA